MREDIRVKSFTYAMKGKNILERHGIGAAVLKRSSECGCIYVISVDSDNKRAALSLLSENGVKLV